MSQVLIALCAVFVVVNLALFVKSRASSPFHLLRSLFWCCLLLTAALGRQELLIPAGLFLIATFWSMRNPVRAYGLMSRATMLWSRGRVRDAHRFFAQLPKFREASDSDVLRMLRDPNALIQACAIDEAVDRDLREAVEPLLALLEDDGSVTPQRVLEALGRLGDESVAPVIERYLTHDDLDAREAALHALERVGPANLEAVASAVRADSTAGLVRSALRVAARTRGAEGVAMLWRGLPQEGRLRYLEAGLELTASTLPEVEAVAVAAVEDPDDRLRKLGASLRRRTIAWRARQEHPELFRPRTPDEPDPEPRLLRARVPRDLRVNLRGGGALELKAGVVALTVACRVDADKDEETGVRATLLVDVADRDGTVWRVAFVLPLHRFVTLSTRSDLRCVYWGEAEDSWSEAFSQALLFRAVAGMSDDREYLEFRVGNDDGDLRVKYLSATFDGAILQDEPEGEAWLLVLTKELIDSSGSEIPPFVARLPLVDLLAAPQVAWTWDPETNEEQEHPGAVAERLASAAEPQPHVRREPEATGGAP